MHIDLNADLGEGFGVWRLGDDDALLDVVTSANVACGFHAGDPVTIRRVCERAATRGVAIGAQVGYRDLAGFGRRRIDMDADDLAADVLYQLGALDGMARVAGERVRYVKPHGALYNTAAADESQAVAVASAVAAYDPALPLLGLPGSRLQLAAEAAGLRFVTEAFADRAYHADGRLVPRSEENALITDGDQVVARSLRMVTESLVTAASGEDVTIRPESLCVHGDTPGAAELARRVAAALRDAGAELAPFAR